jgi:hypothetical protein
VLHPTLFLPVGLHGGAWLAGPVVYISLTEVLPLHVCMQAFQRLPPELCLKLARNCQPVHLPPGAVLFEEDAPADAMYVVLSGRCHVRALPLQTHGAGGSAAAGVGAVGRQGFAGPSAGVDSQGEGSIWESGAFTEKEQDCLQAIQAALKADDMQVG